MANEFIIETGTAAAMQQVLKNVTAELDKQIAKQKQLVGPQNPSISMFDDTLFSPGQMRRGKEMRRQDEREQKSKDSAMKVLHRQALRENNMLDGLLKKDHEERLAGEFKKLAREGFEAHNPAPAGGGRFLGQIPAGARKFFKLGKRIRSMSTMDLSNPRADFNDVDETLGEARDVASGVHRMARRYSMASRVQGGVPFGATAFSRAIGQIAMPMGTAGTMVGAGVAAVLAAAAIGYGVSVKLQTTSAENHLRQSNADTKWNISNNQIAGSFGTGFVDPKLVLRETTKRMIELDELKNNQNASQSVFMKFFRTGTGSESSLKETWLSGNDAWSALARKPFNFAVWLRSFITGNENYYMSKSEIDEKTKAMASQQQERFEKMYRGAISAAELGDTAAWRAGNDVQTIDMSASLRGKIQAITTGNNPAKIHRQAEEAKYALKQFAFTQSEWKAPRVD